MTVELGAVFAGIAAIIAALAGAFDARRRAGNAETKASEALAASPAAMLTGLRSEVQAVVDAYHDGLERWGDERDHLEAEVERERSRADAGEAVVLMLRGEIAVMRIDLASARAELADLRGRFESAIAGANPAVTK